MGLQVGRRPGLPHNPNRAVPLKQIVPVYGLELELELELELVLVLVLELVLALAAARRLQLHLVALEA